MLGAEPYQGTVTDLQEEINTDGSVRQVQQLDYEAEPSHNGKSLVCVVEHSGFSQDDLNQERNKAAVLLDVQFQPVAADHPQTFYNLKTGESKEILMSFRAHPRPTEVLWQLGDDLELLEGGESLDKNFVAEVLQKGPNEGMFTAKLIINDVTEKIAGSSMSLVVANELGRTFYPFKLSLGEKPAAGETPVQSVVRLSRRVIGMWLQSSLEGDGDPQPTFIRVILNIIEAWKFHWFLLLHLNNLIEDRNELIHSDF